MKAQGGIDSNSLDPVIQTLIKLGTPVTRKSYLEIAYPEGLPNEWTADLEAELPEELQYHEEKKAVSLTEEVPGSAQQEPVEGMTIERLEELRAIVNRIPQEGEDEEDDLEAIIAGEKLRRLRMRQRAAAAQKPNAQPSFAIRSPGLLELKKELLERGMSDADAEAYLRTL